MQGTGVCQLLLAAGLLFTGGARAAGAELLWIDPALSSVEVDVQATFDSFTGRLAHYDATLAADPATHRIESARFHFTFADLRTGRALRDRHLREWLDAARFPDLDFRLTALEPTDGGGMQARGEMSLHGVRRDVVFPVVLLVQDDRYALDGVVQLDYRDFALPVIRKFVFLTVDPHLRVRFHLQGKLAPGAAGLLALAPAT